MSLRLGWTYLGKHCHSDNRIKYDRKNYTWYNRTIVTHDKFTIGTLGAFAFTNKVLVKNNLFVGYQIDDNSSAFIRLENDGYRSNGFDWGYLPGYFDHVKLNFVSKYKSVKYGLEVKIT